MIRRTANRRRALSEEYVPALQGKIVTRWTDNSTLSSRGVSLIREIDTTTGRDSMEDWRGIASLALL